MCAAKPRKSTHAEGQNGRKTFIDNGSQYAAGRGPDPFGLPLLQLVQLSAEHLKDS